ncbi:hypothetical protein PIROE2DRAFT_14908, partial [Piromyces sp. E2]
MGRIDYHLPVSLLEPVDDSKLDDPVFGILLLIFLSINYSDTSQIFADGTNYDRTIQGTKKILKLTEFTRNSTTGYYECANNAATLSFPLLIAQTLL